MNKPTKNLLFAGLIAVSVVGYLIITSKKSSAASVDPLRKKAEGEFDKLMVKAKAYLATQTGVKEGLLKVAIAYAEKQKTTIVDKTLTSGQSVNSILAPLVTMIENK